MKNVIFKLIVPLLGIVAMLAFVTWVSPVKQQFADCMSANGTNWCEGNQHYSFDNGSIIVYINPVSNSCSSNTKSFNSSMNVTAGGSNPNAYTVHWGWLSNFCTDASSSCNSGNGSKAASQSSGSFVGGSKTVSSPTTGPSGQYAGLACGRYQNDFGFYVTRNSNNSWVGGVSLGNSLDSTNNNATWCNTGETCSVPPTATPTVPVATATPTVPVATATPTNSPTPTATTTPVPPTATVTPSNTNNCGNNNQSGNNDNNNCNNNNNNNQQQQQQEQNNNQTVNITLAGQQQQQQQVLGMTTLPKTGAEGDILFGLLALIPVGWKLRKLV